MTENDPTSYNNEDADHHGSETQSWRPGLPGPSSGYENHSFICASCGATDYYYSGSVSRCAQNLSRYNRCIDYSGNTVARTEDVRPPTNVLIVNVYRIETPQTPARVIRVQRIETPPAPPRIIQVQRIDTPSPRTRTIRVERGRNASRAPEQG